MTDKEALENLFMAQDINKRCQISSKDRAASTRS